MHYYIITTLASLQQLEEHLFRTCKNWKPDKLISLLALVPQQRSKRGFLVLWLLGQFERSVFLIDPR